MININYMDEIYQLKKVQEKYHYEESIAPYFNDETETIPVNDMILNLPVDSIYCPVLNKGEECHFVEFISSSTKTQAFVPVKEDSFSEVQGNLSLEYYEVPKKVFDSYVEFHKSEEVSFDPKHKVYTNRLVIGKNLLKEME